ARTCSRGCPGEVSSSAVLTNDWSIPRKPTVYSLGTLVVRPRQPERSLGVLFLRTRPRPFWQTASGAGQAPGSPEKSFESGQLRFGSPPAVRARGGALLERAGSRPSAKQGRVRRGPNSARGERPGCGTRAGPQPPRAEPLPAPERPCLRRARCARAVASEER